MDKALTSMNGGMERYSSSSLQSEAGIDNCSMYSSSAPTTISSANRYRKDETSTLFYSRDHFHSSKALQDRKDPDVEVDPVVMMIRDLGGNCIISPKSNTRKTPADTQVNNAEQAWKQLGMNVEGDVIIEEKSCSNSSSGLKYSELLLAMKAENMALSKALRERGRNMAGLRSFKEEAESAAVALQVQNDSLHKDVDALKSQIRQLNKKLRLRDEEKERIAKEADAAIQRIAKLQSDCHRLRLQLNRHRSIINHNNYNNNHNPHRNRNRKDYSHQQDEMNTAIIFCSSDESSKRNNNNNNSNHISDPCHECHQLQKQIHSLAERLASTEEENLLLKETLVDRTTELQSAIHMNCAGTVARKLLISSSVFRPPEDESSADVFSTDDCLQSSVVTTNLSAFNCHSGHVDDDGYGGECCSQLSADSWALALMSQLSHIKDQEDHHANHNIIRNGVSTWDNLQIDVAAASCKYSSAAAATSRDPSRFAPSTGAILLEEISDKISSIEDSIYAWLSEHETRFIQHGRCFCSAADDDDDDSGDNPYPCSCTSNFYRQMQRQFSLTKKMLAQISSIAFRSSRVNDIVVVSEMDKTAAAGYGEVNVTTQIMKRMLRKLVDAFQPPKTDDPIDIDCDSEQKRHHAGTAAGEGTEDPIDLLTQKKTFTAEDDDDDPIDVWKNRFMLQKDIDEGGVSAIKVLGDYMQNRVKEVTWDEEATGLLCEFVDAVKKLKPIDLQLRVRLHETTD